MKVLPFLLLLSLFLVLSLISRAQINLLNGLIAHWPLDGNANELIANRNGQIFGSVTAGSDRFGQASKAMNFSGSGSYIRVLDNGSLNPARFSITAWFKTSSADLQILIGKTQYSGSPRNEQLQLYINYPVTPGIGSVIVPQGAPCDQGHLFAESRISTGTELCRERWYHLVFTFDGVSHKLYLDGVLKASRNTGFTNMTSCLGNYQFGAWWNGDARFFQGQMDDIRLYNRAINEEEVNALGGAPSGNQVYDFSYTQNICDPLNVNFAYNGPGTNVSWLFETGQSGTGKNPVHRFSNSSEFPVSMIVQYGACQNKDTLIKPVNLNFLKTDLIITNDTTICEGSKMTLRSNVVDNFCWAASEFITSGSLQNPEIQPNKDNVYYLNRSRKGNNLVTNGDFSAGNTGFFTTYLFRSANTTEGEYFISPNPQNWNGALSNCNQPLGGVGNMMLVNGVPETNKVVWQQEFIVDSGKTYDFSLYITALFPVNPAILQFAINGVIVGDSIQANNATCSWRKFNAIWNSGKNKKAIISIVNRNILVQGNDFALDNIEFRELILERDSVLVKVEKQKIQLTADTSICRGGKIQLLASGANTYTWFPAAGLDNPNIANPIATISDSIRYFVSGVSSAGCIIKDSVKIDILENPSGKTVPNFIQVCRMQPFILNAIGGKKYSWTPTTNLSDSFISNPTAKADSSILYKVKIEGANGCYVFDSVRVEVQNQSIFKVFPDSASFCLGDTIEIRARGGTRYQWTINAGNTYSTDSVFVFKANSISDKLFVKIWNESCMDSTTLSVPLKISSAPVLSLSKSKDFDCYSPISQLSVSGGSNYKWDVNVGIIDNNLSNPVVTGYDSTKFIVSASNDFGCTTKDSITVDFIKNGLLKVSDSFQVCKGAAVSLSATGASNYIWAPSSGLNDSSLSNPIATIQNTTVYRVVGTTEGRCVLEDSVIINVFSPAEIIVGPQNSTLCKTEFVQLTASGGVSYLWSPAINLNNQAISNPVARVDTSILYRVVVIDTNGCKSIDSVNIEWQTRVPFELNPKFLEICSGEKAVFTAKGGNRYNWLPVDNNQNVTTDSFSYFPSTSNAVFVKIWDDICKDSTTLEAEVLVNQNPMINLTKSNDLDCNNVSAQLFVSGGISYQWLPTMGLSNPNIPNPVTNINTSTTYNVSVKDLNGCKSIDSITVFFVNTGNLDFYQLPTAFTPNGDGLNDCFGIRKWGSGVRVAVFQIFNRWGQMVFSGDSIRNCWDGVFKGQIQPSGNFVYIFRGENECGVIERRGTFILMR